jgi:hypothetical protein
MFSRPILTAGVLVAAAGTIVLVGWLFDFTTAKSVMAGWRVMVPLTAASFVLAGIAIVIAAGHARREPSLLAARVVAGVGLALPLVVFVEYMFSIRTGIEGWFGVSFDESSAVAGRMSPLTSLCFVVLHAALIAVTVHGPRAVVIARIASGATFLTAWLAVLAVALDGSRLADVPRFPNMAVLTIMLLALASWGALALSFERENDGDGQSTPSPRVGAMLAAAFAMPLLLGVLRDVLASAISPQVMTAVLVLLLAAAMAAIVWQYGARMTAL